ncbi:hypothetical protein BIY23_01980 [Wolbachia pipientis]|uniref:Uncharacterized protein n=1 Tax=Wolbachia pipientis TaxID=955 RepID=A0A1E7QJZ8_WOLPI|nr:hypothetical protein BIY23_01980 [Wolbachia pipientis]
MICRLLQKIEPLLAKKVNITKDRTRWESYRATYTTSKELKEEKEELFWKKESAHSKNRDSYGKK